MLIFQQPSQKVFVSYTGKTALLRGYVAQYQNIFESQTALPVPEWVDSPGLWLLWTFPLFETVWWLLQKHIVKWLLGQLCQFSHSDKILCAIKELYIRRFFQTVHM